MSRFQILIPVLFAAFLAINCKPAVGEYSIWLVPSQEDYDRLSQLICDLAEDYPSGCFTPHLTVAGDVRGTLNEIKDKAKTLADQVGKVEVRLRTIGWGTPDERSFYFFAQDAGGDSKLYRLYTETCRIMGECPVLPYHVSLIYTDQIPVWERTILQENLYTQFGGREMVITLDRLAVCVTKDLPPEKWECRAEIMLY